MSDGMANPAKQKGDRAEREAVDVLRDLAPNLCVENAMRMLGAGRADDVGDLRVFDNVAIQVRNYKPEHLGRALRSAAVDATKQAANGLLPLGLGMVPVPRARQGTVRWLATVEQWPTPLWAEGGLIEPVVFKQVSKAVEWLRFETESPGQDVVDRVHRVAYLQGQGPAVLVAPIEAWLFAYSVVVGEPLFPLGDPFVGVGL